ncbi:type IV toxin-antitoxin system AbiEi family antitoxin domain-containing protein [Rhodococcus spelaei]|uniref:Type IV toxin-antitoxin system AbiEi family antitoxin domain-containing protein n=1 Tax=Rhodococcus spelaei TaxID=2546320 RepID=A0A541BS83_9NOCA|nr:type IV toxin-antitoxin system AbiEi family antitoxin domain-containing protein [Rhodococcus spelaei]TQF75129.1 type IV toxin-antitoxin system AbiEi family antitoxin domain-containing protein [Rhodococcus spelaei]
MHPEQMPHELQVLLDAQLGLVTQAQLAAFGFPRTRVRNRLDAGRWQRVLHGVYCVTTGPLNRHMTLMAALIYGGGPALLSHRTAAEEWGIVPVDPSSPVHITVPYRCSAKGQPATHVAGGSSGFPMPAAGSVLHPGVVVHRSRAHGHIGLDTAMPRTSLADTAIDFAVAEPTARAAYVSLISSVTNRRIRLADVRQRIQERTPRRYRKALGGAVSLLAEGVQSMLEYHFAVDVEQAHGLPRAHRQGPVIVDGRTLWEDCDYTEFGVPLIVRLDGRWAHFMREVRFRDRRRDNAAELADRPRLVYGFEETVGTACVVAQEVERVLRREGWVRRDENPCRACESFWSAWGPEGLTGGEAA